MSAEFTFTDNQWYNFICGFYAGMRLKDISLPPYESNIVLHPIGVGGWGTIGIALPTLVYDGSTNTGLIPVFTHDVDIDYSGFSVNILWDSTKLRFDGVVEGAFGTIGDNSSTADIRYTYTNGNLKARGLRDNTIKFKEPIILFFISVTILVPPTQNNPIGIRLVSNSFTDMNYTTLIKWVEIANESWYNFFITPVLNIDGAITTDIEDNKQQLGEETVIAAPSSPTGIYVGTAFTPPGVTGVVPIVSCSNYEDNFPYNSVHCKVIVEDNDVIFTYLNVVGVGGFDITYDIFNLPSGYIELDIRGNRLDTLQDVITFCYIEYQISNKNDSYVIPLNNILSELGN